MESKSDGRDALVIPTGTVSLKLNDPFSFDMMDKSIKRLYPDARAYTEDDVTVYWSKVLIFWPREGEIGQRYS